MRHKLTRRRFLTQSAVIGCSAAASPLVTSASFASLPSDNRLVVIILRGGLDGLDILRPWGDAEFTAVRPTLVRNIADEVMISDSHAMHPRLEPLLPMWHAQELGFVQAVSTPYRDKRSHFDGQDILEAGTPGVPPGAGRDGWLNRMLSGLKGVDGQTAYAIGAEPMLLSTGKMHVNNWSPQADIAISEQGLALLQAMYRSDPDMAKALQTAVEMANSDGDAAVFETADQDMMQAIQRDMTDTRKATRRGHIKIAEFAAVRLTGGARIACFSIGGWDTHRNQIRSLNGPVQKLAETLQSLKTGLGARVWGRTTVLAMTEFGRTVRENGTKGTDHGTGGTMVVAGGALRGGMVHGVWPGLAEADLYNRRDLMPTDDVRRWAAWAIRSSFGMDKSFLEQTVFPGVEMGDNPGLLL